MWNLNFSDKYLPPSSSKAANRTFYIQLSGTMIISGSFKKSATGAIIISWKKRRLVLISSVLSWDKGNPLTSRNNVKTGSSFKERSS